ncbi:hypothetical protein Bhyg_02771 [Pseudolycoriella hygida]|uniref:Uncharacterized protein n=1 Tax=Pseudolycoriella hygida TaxID=35572 RepID=A0A9Q0NCF6_9DIPT|nr:hypothetical protein Bhyg_02771 [Pseudolycoriella hygida]
MATSPAAGKGLIALIKQGWHTYPEVMGSGVVGLVGIGIGFFAIHNYYSGHGDNRRFKHAYVVYRPDDPRVKLIRYD